MPWVACPGNMNSKGVKHKPNNKRTHYLQHIRISRQILFTVSLNYFKTLFADFILLRHYVVHFRFTQLQTLLTNQPG